LRFRDLPDQGGRNLCRAGPQPLDELDIPIVMEVARMQSFTCDELLVAAGIVAVSGVEWQVQFEC